MRIGLVLPALSLGIKQSLNIGHQVIWVDFGTVELDNLTLSVEQILGEVPNYLAVWILFVNVFVDG